MSMCPHRQYCHISELPTCPKCKSQLTTVLARYENGLEQWEWECIKCARVFQISAFKNGQDEFEQFLHEKFGEVKKEKPQYLLSMTNNKKKRRKHGRKY